MRLLLLIIKFALLGVLYLFVFKVFHFLMTDLGKSARSAPSGEGGTVEAAGAELVVTESVKPSVRPGTIFRLVRVTQIGRGRHNQIDIPDAHVSHSHAQINFNDEKYFLEDLGSINGTYINGVRVNTPVPLSHGDIIRIAGVTFKFVRWEYEVE